MIPARVLTRRTFFAMLLLTGLFAQFQTVFACELMDGETQYACCCGEGGDTSTGCAMGGGCQDRASDPAAAMDCCEVSYQEAPGAKTAPSVSASLQVLVLDAPQPPPVPLLFDVPASFPVSLTSRFSRPSSPRVAGADTYLLTNRFRI